jgi:hypothetical protein
VRILGTIFTAEKQQILYIEVLCVYPKLSNMQRACAILSYRAYPAVNTPSTLYLKWQDIRIKVIDCIYGFRFFYNVFLKHFLFKEN